MGKRNRESEARLDGMSYALRQIDAKGVEEFRKEIKWRGANNVGLTITPEEIRSASTSIEDMVYTTVMTISMLALHDEFDFSKEMLEQFLNRFNDKMEGLNERYVEWGDYIHILEEETGIDSLNVKWNR